MSFDEEAPSQAISHASAQALTPPQAGLARPSPPAALVVTNTSESSIKISWGYSAGGGQTGTRVRWGFEPSDDTTIGQKDLPFTQKMFEITGLNPETKYYIYVYGTNTEDVSPPRRVEGTTNPTTSLPASPTNLKAVPTKNTVALTWTGPPNASSYKIGYGIAPSGAVTNTISLSPACTISGLMSNTNYYFDVRSSNSNGDSAPTRITATTLTVPVSPSNLKAVPGVSTMDLTWSGSAGAVHGYVIRYGIEPNGHVHLEQTPALNYSLTGLSRNTLYFVEVTAYGDNGESLPTRITQKTQDGPPIPSRPGPLHTLVNYDTVRVVWPAPQSPQYEITYGLEDKYPEVIGRQTTEHLNFLVKYLAPDSRYFIEVRAFNASGYSEPSQTTIKTGPDMTQPRNLRNPGRTFSETWLTWDKPDDASYLIDYEITCPGRDPVRTIAQEYIAAGLRPEVQYLFRVQPRRPEGPVPALPVSISVVTHDRVPPTRPQGLKLTPSTPGNATLSWRTSEDNVGVTGYEVRRNGGAWVPVTETRHTFSGLVEGATSRFEVRAKDAGGNLSLVTSATFNPKDVIAPGKYPPRNLRITSNAGGTVRFDWDAPQNTSGFLNYLYYFLGIPINVLELTLTVSKLKPGQEYAFVIAAKYETGNSEQVSLTFTANP